jgi:hypothetical protein
MAPRARRCRIAIVEIAQCGSAGLAEPLLHAGEVAQRGRMGQVIRQWPESREKRNQLSVRIRGGELDRLRWGRWLAPQYRRIQVEKSGDEFAATIQRRVLNQPLLKAHPGVTKQPRLTL